MYNRFINRQSRAAVIVAIDSSISMQEWTMLHDTRMRKKDAAALITNFIVDELIIRSTRIGNIRDYYDIGVVQYSGNGIEPIIADEDEGMIHINALHNARPQPVCYNITHREEDGIQNTIPITLHEWIKPKACGIAPMYEALTHIKNLVAMWCDDRFNKNSFPPIVINITDGCCSDAEEEELLDMAKEIQSIGTNNGTTLFFNIQLTDDRSEYCKSSLFPSMNSDIDLDNDGRTLYNMSSTLPEEMERFIKEMTGDKCKGPYKGFARNCSICEILTFTDIGTEGCN